MKKELSTEDLAYYKTLGLLDIDVPQFVDIVQSYELTNEQIKRLIELDVDWGEIWLWSINFNFISVMDMILQVLTLEIKPPR